MSNFQYEATKQFVADHLISHEKIGEERDGCLICVAWDWASEMAGSVSDAEHRGIIPPLVKKTSGLRGTHEF